MALGDLLSVVDAHSVAAGIVSSASTVEPIAIDAITIDSRRVRAGTLFVACRGVTPASRDGHDFLGAAIAARASALVVEDAQRVPQPCPVPAFVVADGRRAAARLAERVVGDPSAALQLVGITGTNGKTTTTWLLAQMADTVGRPAAVLGTLGLGPVNRLRPLGFTTPEAETLSLGLRELVDGGTQLVAMETSSHALATARVDGVRFAAAGFTNLTRDHLDFHGTMAAYLAAKARLFAELLPKGAPAVVPADDDEHGASALLRRLRPDAITWGRGPSARLSVAGVRASARGFAGELLFDGAREAFHSPLIGAFNIENLLVAAGCALGLGVTLRDVAAALSAALPPPGRLQPVRGDGHSPSVVVDYAHTPDALERALHALRPVTPGKLVVVFGCGGDRDAGKRPLMGAVAAQVADAVVITDDNPRSEDGDAIVASVAAGIDGRLREVAPTALERGCFARERARRFAIRAALAACDADDTLLVAGKGHETSQTVGARVLPFDDVREARRALHGEAAPAFLDLDFVCQALVARGLEVSGTPPAVLAGVGTDSRNVDPGSLFVALAGERFDAHDFVETALKAGAGAALVKRGSSLPGLTAGRALLAVDDTLLALQDLARAHLLRLSAHRIAITGSNGKTTTKELVSAALGGALGAAYVAATAGNLNNHIGLPLTALRAEPEHRALVLEMGMNHLGEIALLADIARPHIGVITNMGSAHAGNVGGIEGVARAKAELWEHMAQGGGVAIVNADDPRCVREAQQRAPRLKSVSFGRAPWADVRLAGARDLQEGGQQLDLAAQGSTFELVLPMEGRHNATNACAALAVCVALGLDLSACVRGLASVAAPQGRLQRRRAVSGALVLDDTYNANPDSMEAAFNTLAEVAQGRRRVIALGEMRELGELADAAHRRIGVAAAQSGAEALWACGDLGRLYLQAAVEAGLDPAHTLWASDSEALAALVKDATAAGDIVLVKGSRGARMECVVSALTQAGGDTH